MEAYKISIILCLFLDPVLSQGEIIKDTKFNGKMFRNILDIGWNMCVDDCRRHTDCQSVNYNSFNLNCNLYKYSIESCPNCTSFYKEGYFYKSVSTAESVTTCSMKECPAQHKCVRSHTGKTECIKTECPDPPEDYPVIFVGTWRSIGRQISYTCDSTFYKRPSSPNPKCTIEGVWKYPDDLCVCTQGHYKCGELCCICPAGYYTNTWSADQCQPCPVGHYQDQGGTSSCKLCPEGKYQNATGQTFCSVCNPGTSPWRRGVVNNQCTECYSLVLDYTLEGASSIFTTDVGDKTECANLCEGNGNCMAFTYYRNIKICDLHPSHDNKKTELTVATRFHLKMC